MASMIAALRQRRDTVIPWVGTACRLIAGGVLFLAGYLKWIEPFDLQYRSVQAYKIITDKQTIELIAISLPLLEMLLGVLLVIGIFTRISAWVSSLIFVVFIAGIASVWIRGLNIDCGCFGTGGPTTAEGRNLRYGSEIARDFGLLLCCAWLVRFPRSRLALLDRAQSATIEPSAGDPQDWR
ncbi:MAG: hypothetical protein RL745_8 [Actinomycetota bacterium]|jgi:uncharacterized membrane protein YphA (DoxX/SURF4 family)